VYSVRPRGNGWRCNALYENTRLEPWLACPAFERSPVAPRLLFRVTAVGFEPTPWLLTRLY
jgi:hypothetical protein